MKFTFTNKIQMKKIRKIAGIICDITVWAFIPSLIFSCIVNRWWIFISIFLLFLISFKFLFITATEKQQNDALEYMNRNW